ncbi:MAG: hypothetical protein C0625_06135 [Arcobacter sp.]|nr:MAG: hypothetical protein C0625_06135 [Arcobacter sp.]
MIKNSSLKMELLVSILFVVILGIGAIFYFTYSDLKKEIDISQEKIYNEKIDNIIYLVNQKYQTLLKTQMEKSYEESFKKGTLNIVKNVFDKNNNDIFPFIINEKKFIVFHHTFNEHNSNLYKNKLEYKKILEKKDGNFEIHREDNDRWVIFKYYEPWDWIIGYRINKDVKYEELYKFREIFLSISLIIVLFISLFIILIVRKVLEPVDMLSNVSKKIAAGNLDAKIDVSGTKELKILSANFEKMRDKIVEDIHRLREQEEKILAFNSKLQEEVKLRTKELESEKEVFETLFNKSCDGMSLIKESKFVACNNALLEMLKCKSKEEFLNLDPVFLSPKLQPNGGKSADLVKSNIEKCLEKGTIKFEWLHKKLDGEVFLAEIILTHIVLNNEELIHAVWRNIQSRKELELEIENKNIDLQESNDELEAMIENLTMTQNKLIESEKLAGLGSLVAGVSHEINTPVGIGLTGASHLDYISEEINEKYKKGEMTEEEFENYLSSTRDLVKLISSNLERTADIIKNFKQVAVDETSEQKRVFRVKEYIRGILVSIETLTKKCDIEFKIECDEELEITSYPGFFAQIITNFVSNSIIHAYYEGKKLIITFLVKSDEKFLTLEYSDNGKGISEENLLKIFDPFFTTNRANGGSGLGLNIVYNLVVTNLKGTIDCKSVKNKGTTFIIKVPI